MAAYSVEFKVGDDPVVLGFVKLPSRLQAARYAVSMARRHFRITTTRVVEVPGDPTHTWSTTKGLVPCY